ncbi:MAG: AAA family ATPase [Myxococcota bacterium]|nr:AAA family ATPase [Myxococcota bacterium]
MPRFFNTAGPCNPGRHYMLPAGERLPLVEPLVEQEQYFVVHAARQSGKTTALLELARQLFAGGKYAALLASCEVGEAAGRDAVAAVQALTFSLWQTAQRDLPPELWPPAPDTLDEVNPLSRFSAQLTRWARACPRPVVLFLDEVDALQDESLIAVLRQLREGFVGRPGSFPQSVALIGLRDVRDYKVRLAVRSDGISLGTASPFNVKARSLTLRDFTAAEVASLLAQHTDETGQPFAPDAAAEVFEQSQGQPWLVNALAGVLTTEPDALVRDRAATVTRAHVLQAREILIQRRDTHLDSLVNKLQEPRVQRVIEPILVGQTLPLDLEYDDDLAHARDLGLVARRDGLLRIANPIYQEIIPRVLTARLQESIAADPAWYLQSDGTLDLPKLIDGFLQFWRRHGEVLLRGMPYQEAAPHLVFMAYLQRIVNGGGRVEREFAIGTGRADLVVELAGREDVIELKLLRDSGTLPEGLAQVARYATRLGRDRGYLVLFDRGSDQPWEERGTVEELVQDGVTVVVVRA